MKHVLPIQTIVSISSLVNDKQFRAMQATVANEHSQILLCTLSSHFRRLDGQHQMQHPHIFLTVPDEVAQTVHYLLKLLAHSGT